MHGRYPDYDVLEQAPHWDDVTRELVERRAREVPELRFFDPGEASDAAAFCDVVLAQDAEPRIPVLAMVDEKLDQGKLDGFRYDDMPDDSETWRRVAAGLDEVARARGAESFAARRRGDAGRDLRRLRRRRARGRDLGGAAVLERHGAS